MCVCGCVENINKRPHALSARIYGHLCCQLAFSFIKVLRALPDLYVCYAYLCALSLRRSISQKKKKKKELQLQMLQSRFQSQHLAEQLSRFIGFISSVNGTNVLHWWPNKVNGCQWQRSLHNMMRMTAKPSLNANTHTERHTHA